MKRKQQQPIPIPPRVRSLIGMRFGRLLVKYFAGQRKGRSYWCCQCDCGNVCAVPGGRLLGTSTQKGQSQKSCGCMRADPAVRRAARMLGMSATRRKEICKKMRAAVKRRSQPYSMSASRAAELLGVTVERIEVLVKDGVLSGKWRGERGLWVSSEEVSQMCSIKEREGKRCTVAAIFKKTRKWQQQKKGL